MTVVYGYRYSKGGRCGADEVATKECHKSSGSNLHTEHAQLLLNTDEDNNARYIQVMSTR